MVQEMLRTMMQDVGMLRTRLGLRQVLVVLMVRDVVNDGA